MKKIYNTIKLILLISLLQTSLTLPAQVTAVTTNGINGQPFVSGDTFSWGSVNATENTVYGKESYGGYYEPIWSPPPGTKISKIAVQQTSDSGKVTKSGEDLMILLDNGDVYLLRLLDAFNIKWTDEYYKGNVNKSGSAIWDKLTGDAIMVLSNDHLFTNTDSTTWKVDSTGLNGAKITDVAVSTTDKVYAATKKGIYKEDAVLSTWAKLNTYTGGVPNTIYIDRKNRMLVNCATFPNIKTYISIDSGLTWADDVTGIEGQPVKFFADDAYNNLYAITTNYSSGDDHIYKSLHGTEPWQLADTGISNLCVNETTINAISGDSVLSVATSFGAFESTDQATHWQQYVTGAEQINGLAKNLSGKLVVSAGSGVFYNYAGTAWKKTYPQPGFLSGLPVYDDGLGDMYTLDSRIFEGIELGRPALGLLEKSVDGGNTWAPDTVGLKKVGGGLFFVDEKGAQHIGGNVYDRFTRLWQRPKNGSWSYDTVGFSAASTSSPIFIQGFASDKAGYLYATGSFAQRLMRRPIAGGTWTIDTAGLPADMNYFEKMKGARGDVIGISDNSSFGTVTSNSLYHRGAGTWGFIPLPVQPAYSPKITAIAIDSSGYIFAAITAYTGTGVYFTGDLGAHWKFAGLDSMAVTDMVSYGDTTYVLTSNHGAFMLSHASALPVTLSAIKAYQLGKGIMVEWSGYNEVNMGSYDVERSANGTQFNKMGNLAAKNNIAGENKYNWFDATPFAGDNFYRVKALSKDGTFKFSAIVRVDISNGVSDMIIFPNPANRKTINVQLNNIAAGNYSLVVYGLNGQRLYARNINHPGGNAGISIDAHNLAQGLYWVILKGAKLTYKKTVAME